MKFFKWINSKRVGAILALVFIVGLFSITVYSRAYVERRKPLVQIAYPESSTLIWSYETRGTIEAATGEYAEQQGVQWTIEVLVPYDSFKEYTSELHSLEAYAVSDNVVSPEFISFLRRTVFDNGDHVYVFAYSSPHRTGRGQSVWAGEEVKILLSNMFDTSYDYLVPPSALYEDFITGEPYIFTIMRRESAWGREYVAVRQDAMIGSPNRIGNLVNLFWLPSDDPVVVTSDQPLSDGMVVRLFD